MVFNSSKCFSNRKCSTINGGATNSNGFIMFIDFNRHSRDKLFTYMYISQPWLMLDNNSPIVDSMCAIDKYSSIFLLFAFLYTELTDEMVALRLL